MADNEVTIKLIADAKQAIDSFNGVGGSVEALQSKLNSLNKTQERLRDIENERDAALAKGDSFRAELLTKQLANVKQLGQEQEKALKLEMDAIAKSEAVKKKAADDDIKLAQQVAAAEIKADKESAAANELKNQRYIDGIKTITSGVNGLAQAFADGSSPIAGVENILSGIGELGGKVGSAFAAIINGVLSTAESFFKLTENASEAKLKLDLINETSGVSRKEAQALIIANQQVGGSYLQAVQAIDRLSEARIKAQNGDEKAILSLDKVGISLKKVNDVTVNSTEFLKQAAIGFAKLPEGAEKAAAGIENFSLRGQKGVFNLGKNFDSLNEAVEGSGLVLDKVGNDNLAKFLDKTTILFAQLDGLRNLIAAELAPTFTTLADTASKTIKKLKADPEVVLGFEAILKLLKGIIGGFGDFAVAITAAAGKFAKFIGEGGQLLLKFSNALGITLVTTRDLSSGLRDTAANIDLVTNAGTQLEAQLKRINEENKDFLNLLDARGKNELAIIEGQVDAGLQTREKADIAIAESAEKSAMRRIEANELVRQAVGTAVSNEQKQRQANLDEAIAQEKSAQAILLQLNEDYYNQIKKLKERGFSQTEIDDQLRPQFVAIQQLEQQEKELEAQRIASQEKVASFRKASNTSILVDESKLDEQEKKIRAAKFASDIEFQNAKTALNAAQNLKTQKQNAETAKAQQEADAKTSEINKSFNNVEIAQIIALKDAKVLNARQAVDQIIAIEKAELDRKLSNKKKELEAGINNNTLDIAARKKLSSEILGLENQEREFDEQTKKRKLDADKEVAANKIATFQGALDLQRAQDEQALSEKIIRLQKQGASALDIEKAVAAEKEKNFNREIQQIDFQIATLQKIPGSQLQILELEKQRIQVLTKENELLEQQKAIRNSITDTISNIQAAANDLDVTQTKLSNDATDAISKLAGQFGAFMTTFDAASASIAQFNKQIEDTAFDITRLKIDGAQLGVVQSFEDTLATLVALRNKKLEEQSNQLAAQQLAAQDKLNAELLAKEESLAKSLLDIIKQVVDAKHAAKEQEQKDLEANKQAQIDAAEKLKDDLESIKNKEIADEASATEKANDNLIKLNDSFRKEDLAKQREFTDAKNNLATSSKDKALSILEDEFSKRIELEQKIKNAKPGDDVTGLQKQLAESNKKTNDAMARQKEIAKAIAESTSKEELDIKEKAINDKYDLQERAQAALDNLVSTGNAEEDRKNKEHLAALFAEQQANADLQTQNKLDVIKRDAALAAQGRIDQQNAIKSALDEQLATIKQNAIDAQKARNDAYVEEKEKLDEQNAAIIKKYMDTLAMIAEMEKKQLEDLATNAGLAKTAFFDLFEQSNLKALKFLDTLKLVEDAISKSGSAAASGTPGGGSGGSGGGGNGSAGTIGGNPGSGGGSGSPIVGVGDSGSGAGTLGITRKPPNNADSGQGAGAGTSKGNGQQPGATGLPNAASINSVNDFIVFASAYYKSPNKGNQFDFQNCINDFAKASDSLVTGLKLSLPAGTLIAFGSQLTNIATFYVQRNKSLYNTQVGILVNNLVALPPGKEDAGGGSGKLDKGGNSVSGVGVADQGTGGGKLGGLPTSRTIIGATLPKPKKPGEDRSGLGGVPTGVGEGIDNVDVGFSGAGFGAKGEAGAKARDAANSNGTNTSDIDNSNTNNSNNQDGKSMAINTKIADNINIYVIDQNQIRATVRDELNKSINKTLDELDQKTRIPTMLNGI